MSKRAEMQRLISDMRYQLWPGVSTWSQCSRCDKAARGGRVCADCLGGEIDELISSPGMGSILRQKIHGAMQMEGDMLWLAEDADAKEAADELTRLGQEMGGYD